MTTTRKSAARLLPLLALLALAPLALVGCDDAGDAPAGPSGPSTQYNPGIDLPGATITLNGDFKSSPGGQFQIIAAFKNAAGVPVQGVPLYAFAETWAGKALDYFDFETNPTITGPDGRASIDVLVSAGCPEGSYRLVVRTIPAGPVSGPFAMGFTGVVVSGTGVTAVTSIALSTSNPTVTLNSSGLGEASFVATVSAINCTSINMLYDAVGGGVSAYGVPIGVPNPDATTTRPFTQSVSSDGILIVIARARCDSPVTDWVTSNPVTVTVKPYVAP